MQSPLNRYLTAHSTPLPEALGWIERQTHIHTNYPQMLSGPLQGQLLKMLVEISGARRVLEIGAFTGYSTACLAAGLPEDGMVDTLEINDELEDLCREGWERAGLSERISLHIGSALELIPTLEGPYDFIYIDANKREYSEYYEAVMPLLRPGGLIVTDDVCLGEKVCSDPPATDPQTIGLIRFNETVASDPRVEVVILPIRDGVSLIRKKLQK